MDPVFEKRLRFGLATLAGILACGVPLWPIPYKQVSIGANPAPATWIILGSIAGLVGGYVIRDRFRAPVLAVTLGFMLAVWGRVEVETSRDETLHNLWPFEVAIAAGFGLLSALIGVTIARLVQQITSSS